MYHLFANLNAKTSLQFLYERKTFIGHKINDLKYVDFNIQEGGDYFLIAFLAPCGQGDGVMICYIKNVDTDTIIESTNHRSRFGVCVNEKMWDSTYSSIQLYHLIKGNYRLAVNNTTSKDASEAYASQYALAFRKLY